MRTAALNNGRLAMKRLARAKSLMSWAVFFNNPMKGMLDPRFGLFKGLGQFLESSFRHGFYFAALGGHIPLHFLSLGGDFRPLLDAEVTSIGMDLFFLPMQ